MGASGKDCREGERPSCIVFAAGLLPRRELKPDTIHDEGRRGELSISKRVHLIYPAVWKEKIFVYS